MSQACLAARMIPTLPACVPAVTLTRLPTGMMGDDRREAAEEEDQCRKDRMGWAKDEAANAKQVDEEEMEGHCAFDPAQFAAVTIR